MRVLCLVNNVFEFNDYLTVQRLTKYIHLSDGQLNIEKGKEYCVYGVIFRDNTPWYYLCLDSTDECPTPYPAELFEISNGQLSSFWRLSKVVYPNGIITTSLVFEEWANDPFFYEKLSDGEPQAVSLFKKYRSLMDNEAER